MPIRWKLGHTGRRSANRQRVEDAYAQPEPGAAGPLQRQHTPEAGQVRWPSRAVSHADSRSTASVHCAPSVAVGTPNPVNITSVFGGVVFRHDPDYQLAVTFEARDAGKTARV